MSKCVGCGAELQSLDKNQPGYIPVSCDVQAKAYCQRCFKIRHHNYDYSKENYELMMHQERVVERHQNYLKLLKDVKKDRSLVLLMIDALDIYTGIVKDFKTVIGDNPVWILVNKSELYPKSLKLNKIKEQVESIAKEMEIDSRNVFFISSLKEKNVDLIMDRMFQSLNKKHYPSNNIYLLGQTSVGKSTFVNMVLKKYAKTEELITTSMEANTTFGLIKIGLGKNHLGEECYLIDTPGYLNTNSLLSCAPMETLKILTPKNYIKVKTYQLKEGQTIFLGGLVRLDFDTTAVSFSFYGSNELIIHRTKTINADKVFSNLQYRTLVPPFSADEAALYRELVVTKIKVNKMCDIWLSGIGIVHLVGEALVKITAFDIIKVTEANNGQSGFDEIFN